MNRVAREDGFTLIELLVAAMLMIVVMSATLGVLDQFVHMSGRADRRVDLQDDARDVSRQIARSLRNAAVAPDRLGVIERAGQYDLVFRAVDAPRADSGANTRNLKRLRYCLDAADPSRGRLLELTQRWESSNAEAMPSSTACPGTGWDSTRVLTDRITNRVGGANRPLWTFGQNASGQITSVNVNLFMNLDPKFSAREVSLQTGVFLRNQNRAPTAVFSATAVGTRNVLLNASGSTDPEGDPLDYVWSADGVVIGRGLTFNFEAPVPGNYVFKLEVFDPTGMSDHTSAQPIQLR